MRYLVGFVVVVAASPLNVSAQDGEESASSEPNLEEPVSTSAPEAEVPDIDTLSQRAIEHFEIQYEIQSEEKQKHERRRRRGLAIGVSIAVAVVVVAVLGGATASSID
jgi:hypothetical protein